MLDKGNEFENLDEQCLGQNKVYHTGATALAVKRNPQAVSMALGINHVNNDEDHIL